MMGRIARYEHPVLVIAFLVAASAACLFFAMATPAGQSPDERAHALRADSVRRGVIVGSRWEQPSLERPQLVGSEFQSVVVDGDAAGGTADPALLQALEPFSELAPGDRVTPALFEAARAVPWKGPMLVDFPNTIQYPPTFYLGGAVALAVAQAAGFGPYDAAIGIRLVNSAQFLVLGALALWLAVAGRLSLFVILTLPMTLFVAASTSQDGIMIAAAALAAALVSRLWRDPAPHVGRLALLAVILATFVAARPTNAPLALLLLLPQPGIAWRPRLVAFAAVALVTLGWSAIAAMMVAVPMRAHVDTAAQLARIGKNPAAFLAVLQATIDENIIDYLEQMVGRFGLLQIAMPRWSLQLYLLPVVAAIIGDMTQAVAAPRTRLIAALAIVVGGAALIAIAQYLTWTPVGGMKIEGVQGRYFLVLATAIGLGVAGLFPLTAPWPRAAAVLGVLAGPVIGAFAVPGVILDRYYGP